MADRLWARQVHTRCTPDARQMHGTVRSFWNLELAGVDDFAVAVTELEDVNAPVKVVEIDYGFGSNIIDIIHFFTQETENLEVIWFVVVFLEVEVNKGGRRVGIELYDPAHWAFLLRRGRLTIYLGEKEQ